MAVIDELIERKGTTRYPNDSYDNKMIDEIVVEGQSFHFAKQKDLTGTSEIIADNGVAEPIRSLGVSGNTSQKSYGGYQLLQFKDYSDSRTDSDGNVLTWEIKDGIVTVNGKQNKLAFVTLDYKSFVTEVYEAGTYSYTASYYRDGNNVGGCDWAFRYADDNTSRITGYTDGRTSRIVETKTIDKPFRLGYVQLYIYANTEYKDFKYTIGLFKGSYTGETMPPYEPYVGGIPSPNPQYPQEIENANKEGMSVTLHGDNLLNKEEFLYRALREETEYSNFGGVCLNTEQVQKMLKPNTQYTISYDVEGIDVLSNLESVQSGCGFALWNANNSASKSARLWKYPNTSGEIIHANYTITTPSDLTGWKMHSYNYNLTVNGQTGFHNCIFRNVQIVEGAEAKPYQPYFREEIAIPPSVEVEGATVPLLFTQWDKLTVDRLNNKVIYTEGSWQRAITGKENWFESWGAISSGYGKFYCLKITPYRNGTLRDNEGYSNYFKRARWVESAPKNSFIASHSDGDLIIFCTDKTTKVADIKIWLQERYAEGNPVVFLVRRYTYLEHDITNTDLGQSLLALATGKGANYLEITGHLAPSQTDLSYWRQIIPNE